MADDIGSPVKSKKEIVSWQTVFGSGRIQFEEKLSSTKVGYHLLIIMLAFLALVTTIILVDYFIHSPTPPSITGLEPETLENYKRLDEIAFKRTLKLFEEIVHKAFLPVLMAILGYTFGVRGSDGES